MPKARLPAVDVQFGGKPCRFVFDFNARAELQDVAGTYVSNVANLKACRALFWALLLHDTVDKHGKETSRTLSIIQVGEIIDELVDTDPEAFATLKTQALDACGISEVSKVEDRPTSAIPEPPV